MDKSEFARLRAHAKQYGDALGVSAELQMVEMEHSSFDLSDPRIVLRVFRLMPGQQPREYSEASGYALDTKDLKARIEKDIDLAAGKLYEVL